MNTRMLQVRRRGCTRWPLSAKACSESWHRRCASNGFSSGRQSTSRLWTGAAVPSCDSAVNWRRLRAATMFIYIATVSMSVLMTDHRRRLKTPKMLTVQISLTDGCTSHDVIGYRPRHWRQHWPTVCTVDFSVDYDQVDKSRNIQKLFSERTPIKYDDIKVKLRSRCSRRRNSTSNCTN